MKSFIIPILIFILFLVAGNIENPTSTFAVECDGYYILYDAIEPYDGIEEDDLCND